MSRFRDEVEKVIGSVAAEKGYRGSAPVDPYELPGNDGLSRFVRGYLGGEHQHALGEAVYKIVRFNKRRDLIDIVKAAAWCELAYNAEAPALDRDPDGDIPIGSFPTVNMGYQVPVPKMAGMTTEEVNYIRDREAEREVKVDPYAKSLKRRLFNDRGSLGFDLLPLGRVISTVITEMTSAELKHGNQAERWLGDPTHALAVLTEEVGELAQAILDHKRSLSTRAWSDQTTAEMRQVAAVALLWLTYLEGPR